jgi:FXSXX-COOH protein
LIVAGRQTDGEVDAVAEHDGESEWRSDIADVSELSLRELTDTDESPLAASLRRITADLTGPDEPIAGFNSAL